MNYKLVKKLVAISTVVSMLPLTSLAATVTMTMTGSSLTLTEGANVTMSGLTVSESDQTSTGNLDGTSNVDLRGTLVGWNVTATMTHIKRTLALQDANGTAAADADVTAGGSSNCTIAPASSNGSASHTVTFTDGAGAYTLRLADGTAGTAGTISASASAIGDGVTITKGVAFPTSGDVVRIPISCARYTANTETPADLIAVSGLTYGLTTGTAGVFAGSGATSDASTILTADQGTGNGSYTFDVGMSQTVLKNSAAGAHTGTLTLTVS